eukprot:1033806-Lingulodinium_polyedra.AAC.1
MCLVFCAKYSKPRVGTVVVCSPAQCQYRYADQERVCWRRIKKGEYRCPACVEGPKAAAERRRRQRGPDAAGGGLARDEGRGGH